MVFKRVFDFSVASILLILLLPVFLITWILCAWNTQSNGFFFQTRIGQYGKPFHIVKFRTYHRLTHLISPIGNSIRKYKLDEIPQLFNIIKGEMSLVGPRPDVPGYYDALSGIERDVLKLKPGLTCEASIKYWNEDELLSNQANPLEYNDQVIFPDKVKMNLDYLAKQSFFEDIKIIFKTIYTIIKH